MSADRSNAKRGKGKFVTSAFGSGEERRLRVADLSAHHLTAQSKANWRLADIPRAILCTLACILFHVSA